MQQSSSGNKNQSDSESDDAPFGGVIDLVIFNCILVGCGKTNLLVFIIENNVIFSHEVSSEMEIDGRDIASFNG